MRPLLLLLAAMLGAPPARSADALAEARRLYNQGQYDAAERAAREAVRLPATADGAEKLVRRWRRAQAGA